MGRDWEGLESGFELRTPVVQQCVMSAISANCQFIFYFLKTTDHISAFYTPVHSLNWPQCIMGFKFPTFFLFSLVNSTIFI